MRCKAISDGLIDGHYIHAGEEFTAIACPRWAVAVDKPEKPAKVADKKKAAK